MMNLILPDRNGGEPGPMPTWSDDEFERVTFEQIEPYLRGRISYIRALDTGARKVYPEDATLIGSQQTPIFFCDMSIFQYQSYLRAERANPTTGRQAFNGNERQASNFVFPDGSWGISGSRKYIESRDNRYEYRNNAEGNQLRALMQIQSQLQLMSCKYHEIVQICRSAYYTAAPNVAPREMIRVLSSFISLFM